MASMLWYNAPKTGWIARVGWTTRVGWAARVGQVEQIPHFYSPDNMVCGQLAYSSCPAFSSCPAYSSYPANLLLFILSQKMILTYSVTLCVTWHGNKNAFTVKRSLNVFSTDIPRVFAVKKHMWTVSPHIHKGFSFALAIFAVNSHPVCQPVHNAKLWQYHCENTSCCSLMSFILLQSVQKF